MLDRTLAPLAVAAVALAGCATAVSVGTPTLDLSAAEARAGEIATRTMSRTDAHVLLGEPWLASASLGVEVYRLAGKQRNLGVIFAPYPVPFPLLSDKLVAYTLVTYDADDQVVEKAFGFLRAAPGKWPGLVLRAGDFEFVHAPQDTLSVTLDRFLKAQAAGTTERTCTILVGCDNAPVVETAAEGLCSCAANLYVDDGERNTLVLARALFQPQSAISAAECHQSGGYVRTLAGQDSSVCQFTSQPWHQRSLAPGEHTLRFTLSPSDQGITSELTCRPDEVTFVTLAGRFMYCHRTGQPLPRRQKNSGPGETMALSQQAPAAPHGLRVVVYEDGHWLFPRDSTNP